MDDEPINDEEVWSMGAQRREALLTEAAECDPIVAMYRGAQRRRGWSEEEFFERLAIALYLDRHGRLSPPCYREGPLHA
ncbi:MAG TPA: hypothetical protein VFS15_22550 [Kofleriaceae bacterium]|nr:hypothetical protein [Kofleriaceae bacterium]